MSDYYIKLAVPQALPAVVNMFKLTTPNVRCQLALAQLSSKGVDFSGQIAGETALSDCRLYLEQAGQRQYMPLLAANSSGLTAFWQKLTGRARRWQFAFTTPLHCAEFTLGLEQNGQHWPLQQGKIEGSFKVLAGKDGWLFLDNDTNKSVEQFTGKLLLTADVAAAWQCYFADFRALAEQLAVPYSLLLAPSKEQVFPEFYPFAKADITPIDQLLAMVPANFQLAYPVKRLHKARYRSYRLTDTHWSPYGACIASLALAWRLGLSWRSVKAVFAKDRYIKRQVSGDLGNKFFPPLKADERFLSRYNYRQHVLYDNGLANFGRVLVLENSNAYQYGRLLLFGSSSAYSMLDYLSRIFSEVILIHSAGNIDLGLTQALQPDYLVAQTNGRFVVKAPMVGYSLQQIMAEKLQAMPQASRVELQHNTAQVVAATTSDSVAVLQQVLLRALAALPLEE